MTRLPAHGDRAGAQRDGLVLLARLLTAAHDAGTLSEALEIVAQSLAVDAGAAYEVDRDELVLVAHRGLSLDLRTALERLPRAEEPWFIATRAASRRRLLVEPDVAATTANPEVAQLFGAATRIHAAAVPLVAGREVLGVIVLFHRRADPFDASACAFLETAAGLITLARKSERASPAHAALRREEARMGPLAMAGMLAAHFADDVRGPLAAIGLVLRAEDRAIEEAQQGDGARDLAASLRPLIAEAQGALTRARTVTDQIVAAAQAGRKEKLLFADILRDAVTVVAPSADARGVTLVQQIQGDGFVLGRRSELVPAFVAMITNAMQACEHGPRTRPPTVKIATEDDARGVAVTIEDTGAGVAADLRSRIFEPFFSTQDGAGGIGLTLAKHAIVSHSGHLEIAMSPTLGGALFRAVLPRAATTRKLRRTSTSLSSATLRKVNARPNLLWIDRDDVFLAGARRALDAFELTTAATAAEGEELILRSKPPPEIVFCEIDLVDRSGIDLHADVARKSADLAARFVFVTDGILSPERAAYVLGSGCPSLLKPIDLDDIRALVQTASGEREAPSARTTTKPGFAAPDVDDPFDD